MHAFLKTAAFVFLTTALVGSAYAADLIVDEPAVIAETPTLSGLYVEIYGGGHLGGTSTYYDYHADYNMLAGPTLGASVGISTPIPGLSAGLDVMWTSSEYDYGDDFLRTLSVMAEAEYAVPLNETFELYGAAGLGVINITFDDGVGGTWSGTGAGYQAAVGVRAKVLENVSLFAEFKHQDSFGYVDVEGDDVSWPTNNALVGLRFSF